MEHSFNSNNNCPICDSQEAKDYISATDHNVSKDVFNISECTVCGLRYTNPKVTEQTISEYYKSEDYISHSNTNKGVINKLYHLIRRYQIKQKEKLITRLANKKTLLDFGCGTGDFINYCKGKSWVVTGLEPDKTAKLYAEKKFNLKIY